MKIEFIPTGKPLYEQIADSIRAAIYDGTLKDGDKLPSVRELTKELDVSDITVKRAYLTLKNNRLAYTVSSKGTFVHLDEHWRETRERELLSQLTTLADELRKLGANMERLIAVIESVYENCGE